MDRGSCARSIWARETIVAYSLEDMDSSSLPLLFPADVAVITFRPELAGDYAALNREWIEKYFKIEPKDIEQLEQYQDILSAGGQIFFIMDQSVAVGVCAMIPHGHRCYELAKMAVSPSARGKGFGDVLMRTSIHWAREQQAEKICLLSNTILEPAIKLYKKHGFVTTHLGPHLDYERCNIEMELVL